jgi:asparagine synthetase B (glutamine-hydrolysing)
MDFNIASALNLAARGHGLLLSHEFFQTEPFLHFIEQLEIAIQEKSEDTSSENVKSHDEGMITKMIQEQFDVSYLKDFLTTEYTTSSKVLLSGLGADEVFGGYARYATAFKSEGGQGLKDEISLDLDRLWVRNFGRDDRAISSTGRETRYPFLD